ncbi:MAG: hypothetical protein IKE27_08305 [Oscillospiraceae bacterium]|nr:hypothetical protein [Oscillospiraceae bacterium]
MKPKKVKETRARVQSFLAKMQMDADSVDFESCLKDFKLQMGYGLDGTPDSLLMIPTFIPVTGKIKRDKSVITIDCGGTNLRVALVTFNDYGKALISDFKKYPMIGTEDPVDADTFFDRLAEYIAPLCEYSDDIGFCFSFPCEIQPNKDGKIIIINKGVRISGAENRMLGEGLNGALEKLGIKPKNITVINDTVAAMLAGISENMNRKYSNYFGFIYGTGINMCYAEQTSRIGKISGLRRVPKVMGINMENGDYNGFTQGKLDLLFDTETPDPGNHPFEKMISGAYFGRLLYLTMQKACSNEMYSKAFAKGFESVSVITLKDVDEFILYPEGDNLLASICANNTDREITYYIIDELYERAARMVAVTFCATMEASETGHDPLEPVCITVEGTAYSRSPIFPKKLQACIDRYIEPKGLYCDIVQVRDADLIGTAIAALQ